MAQKTKIKNDFLGLYVIAGGYIARPFYGTIFKEGDEVKTHHFGGSTNAGVTYPDQNFKKNIGIYEIWCTTGTPSYEYDKIPKEEIKSKYDWYQNHHIKDYKFFINQEHNFKFRENYDPLFKASRKYNL